MSDISEHCWCAGWMDGLEFRLWELVEGDPDRRYGESQVTERDIEDLRAISQELGGWMKWDDGEQFVPLDQWLEEYRQWKG